MQEYFQEIVKSISEIVKFDSVQTAPLEGMPFGKGTADSLRYFLELAQSFGFETHNYDNYIGEVVFGNGKEFAILAHLDVVPVGNGWEHDPFGGEIDPVNEKIWGRGTMDDKGPAIVTLYALRALKEEGFIPNRKIKLIVGCNEEAGWECIQHYRKVAVMPEEGFSPDAEFPIIYAEKGIHPVRIAYKLPTPAPFAALQGGTVVNAVCDYCEATLANGVEPDYEKLEKFGLTFVPGCEQNCKYCKDGGKIVSRGVAAHASTPEKGKNAIEPLLRYFGLDDLADVLFADRCGIQKLQDETGHLTFSPDLVTLEDGVLYFTCDIRYPATLTSQDVCAALDTFGLPYTVLEDKKPLFCDKNSPLIQTLLGVYNSVTGEHAQPIAIGGGTYARALKNGCGFGPETADIDNRIHNSNEFITFGQIRLMYEVYYRAIAAVCQ